MRSVRAALAGLLWIAATAPAHAGVVFFVDDEPGFAAATASHVLLGSEDWSSAGAAPAAIVSDPVLPGVANGPFPNGVAAATGMTVQSNSLGGEAATPAPGGGLFYAPAGFTGVSGNAQPSNQLSSNVTGSSFDLLFAAAAGAAPSAIALSPMFYRITGDSSTGTIAVQVFASGGALLGETSVPDVADVSESSFLGVVVTAPDALGRINLWAGATAVAGADNVDVYAAPEPGAAAAAAVALAALRGAR
ncbi:MAG: hypothetical protein DCC71_07965, partial [Proteobacteria bacterium]